MKKLIMCSMPGCIPCKVAKPVAEKVCKELGLEFEYLDMSEDTTLSQRLRSQYALRAAPSFILEEDEKGKVVAVGGKTADELNKILKEE